MLCGSIRQRYWMVVGKAEKRVKPRMALGGLTAQCLPS